MSQFLSQSKGKKIIVISFHSLSPSSNSVSNVFELFASFKAANALNHWNLSLIQAVKNCLLVGHIDPHVIMLGGGDNFLEIIKLAWMKQLLKPPLGFTIQYLGELCNFLVSKTPQCSSAELEESVCKCICELINTGMPSSLKYIVRHITKFIPTSRDCNATDSDKFLTTEMIKSILDSLQQKGLVYNTGHGYNVMTADKLRVAKWLGELPDVRMATDGFEQETKPRISTIISDSKSSNQFLVNQEQSENTEDCLSCYDLRGNKYYSHLTTGDLKPAPAKNSRYQQSKPDRCKSQCVDSENNNRDIRLVQVDSGSNKARMLCTNIPKKDLIKRSSCVKYESNFISRIICGMKKFRIHWPTKNGIVRSSNIGVPYPCNRNFMVNYTEDSNVINSRLSQSMYAFNQITDQRRESGNNTNNKYQSNPDNRQLMPTEDIIISEQAISFIPYSGTKSISPVIGCNEVNYLKNNVDKGFMLIDEQRCCSELMLTCRSSVLTPNIYSIMPPQTLGACDHNSNIDGKKNKLDKKNDLSTNAINDQSVIPPANNRYFSPFTCDSGFNSVHGTGLPEIDTSQSKTSSPPDLTSSKNSAHYNCQPNVYGGPCAWQLCSLNDSAYQTRNYPNPILTPVIESSKYNNNNNNNNNNIIINSNNNNINNNNNNNNINHNK